MHDASPCDVLDVQSAVYTIARDQATLLNILGMLLHTTSEKDRDAQSTLFATSTAAQNRPSRNGIQVQSSTMRPDASIHTEVTYCSPIKEGESPIPCRAILQGGLIQGGLINLPQAVPSTLPEPKAEELKHQQKESCKACSMRTDGQKPFLQEVQEAQMNLCISQKLEVGNLVTSNSAPIPSHPSPCGSPCCPPLAAEASKVLVGSTPQDNLDDLSVIVDGQVALNAEPCEKGNPDDPCDPPRLDKNAPVAGVQRRFSVLHQGKHPRRARKKPAFCRAAHRLPATSAVPTDTEVPLKPMQTDLVVARPAQYSACVGAAVPLCNDSKVRGNNLQLSLEIFKGKQPDISGKEMHDCLNKETSNLEVMSIEVCSTSAHVHEPQAKGTPDNLAHASHSNEVPDNSPTEFALKKGAPKVLPAETLGVQPADSQLDGSRCVDQLQDGCLRPVQESSVCVTPTRQNAMPLRTCIPDTPSASEGDARTCQASQRVPPCLMLAYTSCQQSVASSTAHFQHQPFHVQVGSQHDSANINLSCTVKAKGEDMVTEGMTMPQIIQDVQPTSKASSRGASSRSGRLSCSSGKDCGADCHIAHHPDIYIPPNQGFMGEDTGEVNVRVHGLDGQTDVIHDGPATEHASQQMGKANENSSACVGVEQKCQVTADVPMQCQVARAPKPRTGRLNRAQARVHR
jgi:hypothetical protein